MTSDLVPQHLKKYIVLQDETSYTAVDHATWRFIMRQLTQYLTKMAYKTYAEGLKKTGVEVERIPSIESISEHLQEIGWKAIPVSGFIPPAAFMELQSLGFLPIASDMRSLEHLDYTPAPDIVHEAAGHAPFLADPEFSEYLRKYAQVARKAVISSEDLNVYEAIRILSDLKEHPDSTHEQISQAEKQLEKTVNSIYHQSEAALLARMNWWTAEYGLVGDLNAPKIYGAGLLSSLGESQTCLQPHVKKIPFSLKCIEYAYDITEPQPQLFVAKNFKELTHALEEFAEQMSFKKGGLYGLEVIQKAKSVNTVKFNSGIEVSGVLQGLRLLFGEAIYLHFTGRCQLSFDEKELEGHSTQYHKDGFGSPIGRLKASAKCLSEYSDEELSEVGIEVGKTTVLEFISGITVSGKVKSVLKKNKKLILISFDSCTVTDGDAILFDPSWGTYDMAVGCKIISAYGGPADRERYGDTIDFVAKRVPAKSHSKEFIRLNEAYQKIRSLREEIKSGKKFSQNMMESIYQEVKSQFEEDWLLAVEILEIAHFCKYSSSFVSLLENDLKSKIKKFPKMARHITQGMELAVQI